MRSNRPQAILGFIGRRQQPVVNRVPAETIRRPVTDPPEVRGRFFSMPHGR